MVVHDGWVQITPCLRECKGCGKKEMWHKRGKLLSSDYDESSDLFYTDYSCMRCNRAFRQFDAYGLPEEGEEVEIGEVGVSRRIISAKDEEDLKV